MQPKLRKILYHEIIDAYKKDERNFSRVSCTEGDFNGLNFSGADFSGSDLSFSSFAHCNLTDCNFSDAKLEWTSFLHANLTRANFTHSNIKYSVLNNATFDNTRMIKADLSWSLLFNVNWGAVDSDGAIIQTSAFSPSQITQEGMNFIHSKLAALGKNVDTVTHILMESNVSKTRDTVKKFKDHDKQREAYKEPEVAETGYAAGQTTYASSRKAGVNEAYKTGKETAYAGTKIYRKKKGAYE